MRNMLQFNRRLAVEVKMNSHCLHLLAFFLQISALKTLVDKKSIKMSRTVLQK